ncbi:type II toxin-antitoxin system RelE/ParE family toxin [uncultured Aquimarina sp.]|uniref:type II toxin-antitoxin system RelE/ParE family toxin n=1 Tax=uncultured Aquimarina sp. TaxID=575652 RepID=UPI002620BE1C|nr:type II toxin-antitoxin system RelE/ParE family toxin [uncultured Aquimarina sp.]
MGKEIIWTNYATVELNEAFLDLLEQSESIEITTRVMGEVVESVEILKTHPEIYKLDKLRKNNKGTIRAFEKHSYRISYQVEKDTVYIIRIRYAGKEPLEY